MKKSFLPLFLIVLLVGTILSLPMLGSSASGKQLILFFVSKKLHQKAEAEKLHFSWLGPQRLHNITVTSPNCTLFIEELSAKLPFWKLFTLSSLTKKNFASLIAATSIQNASITTLSPESHFSNINMTSVQDERFPLHLEMDGKSSEGGKIFVRIQEENLGFSKGTLQLSLHSFPTLILDKVLTPFTKLSEGFFSALLGNQMELEGSCNIENEQHICSLTLSSPLASVKMEAVLEKNLITLQKDMQADIFLTETFSKYFLKEMSPLFISAESSQKPIHLILLKEGFVCPIHPFSLKEVKIQKAILDLGQIKAKNAAGLALIMGIMKLHLPSHIEEMDVWATPVSLSLYEGALYTDRMDALLDHSIHICCWGNVDLITKEVDMTLGLTADALRETFHFANLPDDYVMTIPVKGTIDQVKIDQGVATAKIAKLMAMKATNAGLINKLLGGIIKEDNIPPPKRPFPWEGKVKKSSSSKKSPRDLFDLFQ